MQTKFYGKTTGNSASKYDVWLSCKLNSQSLNNNTSNVTLTFCLKRNDGYSDSAYNLYQDRNSARITVAGQQKVDVSVKIDTRNNATVKLASWTGDVLHNDDGSLSLALSSNFIMDNTSLSGGNVSAQWSLPTIVRKSTLTFSTLTLNPGSTVNVTVKSNAAVFSHKITWSLGEKTHEIQLQSGVLTTSFTVPVEWAQEIVSSSSANLKVNIYTYNGSVNLGVNSYNLTFLIPATDEYKPSFDVNLAKVSTADAFLDEYVQNISQISVSPGNLQFKQGASFAAITITVGNVSIRQLPATFTLVDSGVLKVTVAVRDSRGLLTVKQTDIQVCDYVAPSLEITELYRCNSDGSADKYGTSLFVKYKSHVSSLNGKNSGTITAEYKTSSDTSFSQPVELQSDTCVLGNGNIGVSNSYVIRFSVNDSVTSEKSIVLRTVPSGSIPFNIKSGGTGAAFGKFSEKDNELSLGWNLSVDGDVNINGIVAYENATVTASSLVEEVAGSVRRYPCFNGCFVCLRFKTATDLPAGENQVLACVEEFTPVLFTPLCSFVNYSGVGQSNAGITYDTGNVVLRSDADVPAHTYVYVSGFYLNN